MSMDQVIHIAVEPSLQNPHHSPDQVECPTSKAERKTREENRGLCLAAVKGDWKTAKCYLAKDRGMLRAKLTKAEDTVIHIAVTAKCIDFVKELLDFMTVEEAAILNNNHDTGLCIAAVSGMMEIADLFVTKNNELPMIRGTRRLTPLGMAAEAGQEKMAQYLYDKTHFSRLNRNEWIRLFFISLSSNLYDIASKILKRYPAVAYERDDQNHKTALHVLAQQAPEITGREGQEMMERCTSSYFKGFHTQVSMPGVAHELLERLWEQVLQRSNNEILELITKPSSVLFDAAMSGNAEFLAVLNSLQDYIVGNYDGDGNNMLHLDGMLPAAERLGAPRENLQMQRELLWFKEVKKIVRPSDRYKKNFKGETPREIFNKTHKDLLKVGKEAMKETSNSCMLVATLISTVVFAAALTVPGSSNKITHTPLFNKDQWFAIFILSNAISLFTSAASIILLLSLLTSSYEKNEFVTSLHEG